MSWFPRTLGVLTAAYGVATLVRPAILAGPAGLAGSDGQPSEPVSILVRAVGVRDTVNGVTVALAPAGAPLKLALAARIAADLGDAAVFGLSPGDPAAKRKAVVVGLAWGALNALALASAR